MCLFSRVLLVLVGESRIESWSVHADGMNMMKCPACNTPLKRNGKTSSGSQRWRCKECGRSKVGKIDNSAKELNRFLSWLLSRQRQKDMPGAGRTFRRHAAKFWCLWPFSPIVNEVHDVVFVDGIHLGRKAVVLIACTRQHVLGWYVARSENVNAWKALLDRIAPPLLVVSDGGSGFKTARAASWPGTQVQRCTYHAFMQVRRYITMNPKLPAGKQLGRIARDLLHVHNVEESLQWLVGFNNWCLEWEAFLAEETINEYGTRCLTHEKLVRARDSLIRLIKSGNLFTYLDPDLADQTLTCLPAMNNQIEGGINAQLRAMLKDHRGMSLARRIKAIFWWCYQHIENPATPAEILKIMPTDAQLEEYYLNQENLHITQRNLPGWGDAITWNELHHTTPYNNTWD